jgi:hypothetical protein
VELSEVDSIPLEEVLVSEENIVPDVETFSEELVVSEEAKDAPEEEVFPEVEADPEEEVVPETEAVPEEETVPVEAEAAPEEGTVPVEAETSPEEEAVPEEDTVPDEAKAVSGCTVRCGEVPPRCELGRLVKGCPGFTCTKSSVVLTALSLCLEALTRLSASDALTLTITIFFGREGKDFMYCSVKINAAVKLLPLSTG